MSNNNNKREQETVEKVCKMVKLSGPDEHHEKENVDPKKLIASTVSVVACLTGVVCSFLLIVFVVVFDKEKGLRSCDVTTFKAR